VVNQGILACLDGLMNIAIEQTEEYVDNQMKNNHFNLFFEFSIRFINLFFEFSCCEVIII
jgi:small nuclear ribonucleoprotein (snRNP)-like protein